MGIKICVSVVILLIGLSNCYEPTPRGSMSKLKSNLEKVFEPEDSQVLTLIDSVQSPIRVKSDSIFTYVFNNSGNRFVLFWWRDDKSSKTLVFKSHYLPHPDSLVEKFDLVKQEVDSIDKFLTFTQLVGYKTEMQAPLKPSTGSSTSEFAHYFIFDLNETITTFKILESEMIDNPDNPMTKLSLPVFIKYCTRSK